MVKQHFRMDTPTKVLNLVKPNDWAISLDLKDAYLHIPIHKSHRKYLRYCIQGKVYQFVALCFGPTKSPHCFTKIISVVIAHLRMQNVRLASYLDDWLIVNAIRQILLLDRERLLNLLHKLGFIINWEKSALIHSQTVTYIGALFNFQKRNNASYSRKGTKVMFSSSQINEQPQFCSTLFTHTGFNDLLYRISTQCQTVYETHTVAPASFLETNNRRLGNDSSCYTTPKATFTLVVKSSQHYKWQIISPMVKLNNYYHRCIQIRFWGPHEQSAIPGNLDQKGSSTTHQYAGINSCVSYNSLFSSSTSESERSVEMRQYHSGTVYQQQGGTKSVSLCYKVWELFKMTIGHGIQIKAAYLSGHHNMLADRLSRPII